MNRQVGQVGYPAWPICGGAIFKGLGGSEGLCAVLIKRYACIAILAEHEVRFAADNHHEASEVKLAVINQAWSFEVALHDITLKLLHKFDKVSVAFDWRLCFLLLLFVLFCSCLFALGYGFSCCLGGCCL